MIEGGMIAGGGGGGKSGGAGGGGLSESADTLKSTSYAQVLDLIAEGEIGGLVDGLKSIYVDDTPLQNADGTNNFTGVTYVATTGTQTQPYIAGFDQVTNEISVGVEVKISTGPVVRTITNSNITSVSVTIQIPGLTFMDSKGKIGGTTVDYAIDIQTDGGGWVEKINESLTGKTSSPYERQYRINLPPGTSRQIRVRRITADSTSGSLNNKTAFKSYTEIIDAKLRYPNSAIVGVKIDASQFKSIPRRGYDVKLLKVRIPTNATVRADGSLAYSGTWNGSFQIAWTTCPAWCYYDLLTNDRYGLGNYVDTAQVDKWSLYTVSRYCNELIGNGYGGTEPRFSCNIWMNTRQEAYSVINQMTSIFRGMSYWQTGSVASIQDAPKDPTYLFTNANVVDGVFSYQGSSAKARHTVALVTWNDPDDMYRQKIEYVEDTAGITRYGLIEAELMAVGCTSRGQAARVGRWLLYSERYETDVVGFKAGSDGALCSPGDIVKISDQYRFGNRTGGRVSAATSTTVTVDDIGTVPTGTKTLYVVGADGVAQTRTVTSVAGRVITVSAAFSSAPPIQSGWAMSGTSTDVQTYRVLTIVENDEGEHEITAIEHFSGKYALVENGLSLEANEYTNLNPIPDTPTGLVLAENTYSYQNTTQSKISTSWDLTPNATSYLVQWRGDKGNFETATTYAQSYDIENVDLGTYEVQVVAINALGTPSGGADTATITTVGNSAAPAALSNLTALSVSNGITLNWSTTADAVWQAEIYENTTNNSATATLIATVAGSSYTRTGLAATDGVRYFWVKLVNTQGVKSAFSNVASATATTAASGKDAVSGYVTNEAAQLFAYANGSVVSYAPATGSFFVLSGTTDVSTSFSLSTLANPQVLTVVYSGQTYSVTGGFDTNEDTANLTIRATGSGAYAGVTIDKVFTLSKSKGGYEIVSTLPTTNLFEGRVVFLTTDGKLYRYASSAWTASVPTLDLTGQVTNAQIAAIEAGKVTGQLTNAQIADLASTKIIGQLTDAQISAIASTKISGQLTDAQIAAVAAAKVTGQLANTQIAAVDATKVTGQLTDVQIAAVGAAKVTGQITTTQITDDAITAAKIVAGAITASEIAAGAVVAGKIAADAVTATEIAAGAVTAGKIAADAVTANEIAANAITASEIAANAVTAGKIAASAVTANEIAAGAVVAGKIAADAVTATEIAAGAITASEIAAGAVIAGKIAANAVTATEISAGAVTAGKIAADAVTANEIAANAVTASEIAAGAVVAGKIAADAVTAGTITAGAVTAGKIAANAITATELAANAVTADKVLAGAITAAKMNVTELSAITATIGTLRTATTGARTEIRDNLILIYDGANTLRVRLGVW